MSRALAICSLLLLLAATEAAAQLPGETDENPPKRYSLSDIGETRTQRQRRIQKETARSLIFEKAAERATLREQRIAVAQEYGISHGRPTSRPLGWFEPNWWTIPRTIYIIIDNDRQDDSPSPAYNTRRF